jgi:hypothetical protein
MSDAFSWLVSSAPHIGGGVVGAAVVALANAAKNATATNLQREQNAAAMIARLDVLERRLDDCEKRHATAEKSAEDCERRYSELSAKLDAVVRVVPTIAPPPPVAP